MAIKFVSQMMEQLLSKLKLNTFSLLQILSELVVEN